MSNPMIVNKLNEANTEEAEAKRKFIRGLKEGKPAGVGEEWEYRSPQIRSKRRRTW